MNLRPVVVEHERYDLHLGFPVRPPQQPAGGGVSCLELSDTKVCEPDIRARLGTATQYCKVQIHLLLHRLFGRAWYSLQGEFFVDNLLV